MYFSHLFAILLILYIHLSSVPVQGQSEFLSNPVTTTTRATTFRPRINPYNRYRPDYYSGKYNPRPSGTYARGKHNDGKYHPSDEGKYTHKDVGGGAYTGDGGLYYDDSGKYVGDYNPYKDDTGRDNSGQYTKSGGEIRTTTNSVQVPSVARVQDRNIIILQGQSALRPKTVGKGTGEGGSGWRIIRDERAADKDGYQYTYETENGILAEETGKIENLAVDENALRSQGYYEYTGDDGLLYRVDYVADENGFVAYGDHIPKTPLNAGKLLKRETPEV